MTLLANLKELYKTGTASKLVQGLTAPGAKKEWSDYNILDHQGLPQNGLDIPRL